MYPQFLQPCNWIHWIPCGSPMDPQKIRILCSIFYLNEEMPFSGHFYHSYRIATGDTASVLCPTFRCFSIISFYFHYLISSSLPPPAFCYHVFLLENLKIFLLGLKFTLWLHYFTIGTLERIEPNGKVEGKLKVYFGKAFFAL